jgi:hypothetical protein
MVTVLPFINVSGDDKLTTKELAAYTMRPTNKIYKSQCNAKPSSKGYIDGVGNNVKFLKTHDKDTGKSCNSISGITCHNNSIINFFEGDTITFKSMKYQVGDYIQITGNPTELPTYKEWKIVKQREVDDTIQKAYGEVNSGSSRSITSDK